MHKKRSLCSEPPAFGGDGGVGASFPKAGGAASASFWGPPHPFFLSPLCAGEEASVVLRPWTPLISQGLAPVGDTIHRDDRSSTCHQASGASLTWG